MSRADRLRLLGEKLRVEREALRDLAREATTARDALRDREPTRLELAGFGKVLHDLYLCVERALAAIAPDLNGHLPSGPDWHAALLRELSLDLPDVRPAVIGPETRRRLEELRAFRHRFRKLYVFDLEWAPIRDLLDALPETVRRADDDLERFRTYVLELAARG